jgi:hypothetical protein
MLDLIHVARELLIVLTKHSLHGFSVVLVKQADVFLKHVLVLRLLSMSLSTLDLLLQQDVTQVDLVVNPLDRVLWNFEFDIITTLIPALSRLLHVHLIEENGSVLGWIKHVY